MRITFRAALAVLILASSAAGLRAQQFPNTAVLRMPQISTTTAGQIATCDLIATIVDEKEKNVERMRNQMRWKDGVWRDHRGIAMVQMLFPLTPLEKLDHSKLRYKLDYQIVTAANKPRISISEYLPLNGSEPYTADAVFPLETVTIDAGELNWSARGVLGVTWKSDRKLGGKAAPVAGTLKQNQAAGGFLMDRGSDTSVEVDFICKGGKKVKWENSGKDLRKLAPGLTLKLGQDPCR